MSTPEAVASQRSVPGTPMNEDTPSSAVHSPPSPQDLANALAIHQAGNLDAAAHLYRSILARQPENSDALHLLGVLHHQQGDHAGAVELISRAVALNPTASVFHANLAEAYRAQGQLERAVDCCRTALRLVPTSLDARYNLGLALQGLGRTREAAEQFQEALRLKPDWAPAHNNLGLLAREDGKLDEALSHFRRAVQADPAFAPAQTNLGQMLLDLGQPSSAVAHCREAVRLQPRLAAAHHNLGNVLRALDQLAEARASYGEALRLSPGLGAALAHMGLVLHREGKLDEALTSLEQAVLQEPDRADYWEFLGTLRHDREEAEQARRCWERVLALAPERVDVRLSLSEVLVEQGHLDEATEQVRAALDQQPDFALAHVRAGELHEMRGELSEAEVSFRTAHRAEPAYAMPQARLATLLRGRLPDADRAELEARLEDPELGSGWRARLLFGLAQVRDAQGNYAGATDCLHRANALVLGLNQKTWAYDPAAHGRFVDRQLQVFDADFFTRTASAGLQTQRPVFIFGLPRSGTTLIEQVLASHSRVHGAGELLLGRRSFEAISDSLERPGTTTHGGDGPETAALRRLAEQHLGGLRSRDSGRAERIVDKMPENYLYLGVLAAMFPQAMFIHCRRDLRDVAVSCWMTDFDGIRWASRFEHIAHRFQQYRRLMDHWETVLPVTLHEVNYEETVTNLEAVARRLVTACGLEWQPACLEFHLGQRPVRTASVHQVRQPVYQKSVGRWKHYERDLSDLFAALAPDDRIGLPGQ